MINLFNSIEAILFSYSLAALWTKLGGNRVKVMKFKNHQTLLAELEKYRVEASELIGGALIHLLSLQDDLKVLRHDTSTPLLIEQGPTPLGVQTAEMKSIAKRIEGKRAEGKREEENRC